MSDHHDDAGKPPAPQGRVAGLPYDFRRLTGSRIRARAWNPGDPRVFMPKAFGWGLGVNWYWLAHPVRLIRARRSRRSGWQAWLWAEAARAPNRRAGTRGAVDSGPIPASH